MKDEIVVEKMLDDSSLFEKAWFFLVTNLILLVAGALLGYQVSENQWDWPSIVMLAILIVLLAIAVLVFYIYRRIHSLTRRQKLQVQYIQRIEADRSHLFKEMQRRIETARDSIYILNYFTGKNEEEFGEEDIDGDAVEARDNYYRALIEKAKQKDFHYKRIVQISNPEQWKVWQVVRSQSYHDHFRQMLDTHAENTFTQLLVRTVQRPSTFILVDRSCLLWQINELVPDPNLPSRMITRMHGMFVIIGTQDNRVIGNFVELFERIESQVRSGRPFEEDDLLEALRQNHPS